MVKWIVAGMVVGGIAAVATQANVPYGVVFGAILAVVIRKWIARNLWM
jgi:hypothetical protein